MDEKTATAAATAASASAAGADGAVPESSLTGVPQQGGAPQYGGTASVVDVAGAGMQAGDDLLADPELAALPPGHPVPTPTPVPFPIPFRVRRSGVYARRALHPVPLPHPVPIPFPFPEPFPVPVPGPFSGPLPGPGPVPGPGAVDPDGARLTWEELRVDVDGLFPTMTVSGSIFRLFGGQVSWIARVTRDATGAWVGAISYRDGSTGMLPQTDVRVRLLGGWWLFTPMTAEVTYSGGGAATVTRTYDYVRAHFREVGMEYDCVSDATAVTSYDLHSHPNRPPGLPATTLTIEDAFSRQGIKVTKTAGDSAIPVADAGGDALWTDLEMHDAMQAHWSRWQDSPQWQVWVLFARLHEQGDSLGGIMFDDIGTAQRQGCAVFSDSFIATPPSGDPDGAAAVRRMKFWTAVHEIGHTFNLAHSWQKSLGAPYGSPWIPLTDRPESRSFMNYPYNVSGSAAAFFADFAYRFDEDELLFLRHAPSRLVQHGAAPWFDHHAFEQVRQVSGSALELSLRVHREPRYEALEPVVAELKLRNSSPVPVVVDRNALSGEDLTVVIAAPNKEPRQWLPYARYCHQAEPQVLAPGESLYASLFLSAGLGGWDIADPGSYRVYAAVRTAGGDVLSAPLTLQVMRPSSREEEQVADELFTEDVGRVLAFGGSRVMERANDVLREAVGRLDGRRVAMHAAAALAQSEVVPGRVLRSDDEGRPRFEMTETSTGGPLVDRAYGDLGRAADTFGHIGLTRRVGQVAESLAQAGESGPAAAMSNHLAQTLEERGVLAGVVEHVRRSAARMEG